MRWLAEAGLADCWTRKCTPHTESCKVENQEDLTNGNDSKKILSLEDLSGPFILLVFGLSLSLLVFLLGKLYFTCKLHKNRNIIVLLKNIIYGGLLWCCAVNERRETKPIACDYHKKKFKNFNQFNLF